MSTRKRRLMPDIAYACDWNRQQGPFRDSETYINNRYGYVWPGRVGTFAIVRARRCGRFSTRLRV